MALLKRIDSHGNEEPYTSIEIVTYKQRVARVEQEVAEIRAAVRTMREGADLFLEEVADFLDREALQLERSNKADCGSAELPGRDDTRERRGMVPTSARRALLIARAFTSTLTAGTPRV
ncbi:hypothetical protein [Streptomyces harbinensis]